MANFFQLRKYQIVRLYETFLTKLDISLVDIYDRTPMIVCLSNVVPIYRTIIWHHFGFTKSFES